MLGAKQKAWFKGALPELPGVWKLWATEVMLMGFGRRPARHGINNDQWDGYAAERKELLDFILDTNIQNLVALTGDIHKFFAGTAGTTGDTVTGRPAVPEFVGGSATSPGLPEETGISPATFADMAGPRPHIAFNDLTDRGFGVLEVCANERHMRVQEGADADAATAAGRRARQVPLAVGARSPQKMA